MRAQADRSEDKKLLQRLSEAINTSVERIHLDECGDWNIFGRKGKIFTDSKLWYVNLSCNSKRHWTATKKKLNFMEVSQDGDEERILKLERMPSQEEAEAIRNTVGLNKRPALTEEYRGELKIRIRSSINKGVSSSLVRLND